ncbi:PREDICTED: uncharacterized protein LOC105953910 [Erythranthe guttata]|uniref:uncharacterized protein LOC105953910 n=1 Tax=Erythranthe guttata TaxID=4155 RepID=UPI00064DA2F1|nr:PREDICTED: uncharacterized protein LOC105953910 [Erythranthe guttata]|eukprot:XP_012833045.1 PREDICTED: uncharacterized protein LOC105953910 [Erythranthe guttata]
MHEEVTSPFTEVASNAVALASTNEKCQKLPITKWLLRAQMIPERRSEELYELKHVPNCIHCHAVRFEYEPKTFCCGNGKVRVATIEMPDEMYDMFVSESEEAVTFSKNNRALNCIFSFTSLGVKLDKDLASAKRGVYTFRAQGMIYSGVTAVKYLYKYIYKGHDRVAVNISQNDEENNIDEINEYQDAPWVSSQEAIWRIYEFNLNEIAPPVIDLHLHLPNQQCVTYWANQNLSNVLKWDHVSKTMLTEYFPMCSRSEKARKYLYKEFPEYYVWDKQGRCWSERKKMDVIGRLHGANPIEEERYYLRLLLNHVRGPTSFLDLLTVNGIRCVNFKEASQKRDLLESDQSVIECLNEAITFQMPHELRRLFATVLVYCAPTDVRVLWDTYFEAMSEDFRKENDTSKER